MTIVLGIVGSFVGGFLGYLVLHKDAQDGFLQPAGIIGSFIGAVIVLLLWRLAALAPSGQPVGRSPLTLGPMPGT